MTLDFEQLINPSNYEIDSLEDEIRAEQHGKELLRHFHQWLLTAEKQQPLDAGRLAAGAEYFLCEFLIGARRQNIFGLQPQQLRQFGGNWYIVNQLEPNWAELEPMLRGAALFYRYLTQVSSKTFPEKSLFETATDQDFFQQRIDAFFDLQDDDYHKWNAACPFK